MAKRSNEEAEALACAKAVPAAFTKADAARYMAVSERTVERLLAGGEITARRIRSRTVILRSDLDAYLAALPVAR